MSMLSITARLDKRLADRPERVQGVNREFMVLLRSEISARARASSTEAPRPPRAPAPVHFNADGARPGECRSFASLRMTGSGVSLDTSSAPASNRQPRCRRRSRREESPERTRGRSSPAAGASSACAGRGRGGRGRIRPSRSPVRRHAHFPRERGATVAVGGGIEPPASQSGETRKPVSARRFPGLTEALRRSV